MEENKKNAAQDVGKGGIGRTNTNNEQGEQQSGTRDISEIDQQEGAMYNGSTGGNFNEVNQETGNTAKNNS